MLIFRFNNVFKCKNWATTPLIVHLKKHPEYQENVEKIDSDPLLFWRNHENKFPILSGLSKRYF
jgi:hypothetical protein